ncbi:MAG: hypothetical protein KatS3mg040_1007 [Candidatus Kapaibacterium sp.]|nr:MAG: hypothetical protein KatS3mg040_1007 [Candidatus Kapabacteria bacterium]
MLITAAIARGLIVAVGIALILAAPTETMRLFGVVAILFGVYRFYVLFRWSSSAPTDDERDEDME